MEKINGGDHQGLDLSTEFAEIARKRRSLEIDVNYIAEASLPFSYYDVVCNFGGIACWRDPLRALANVHQSLKSDGIFVMNYFDVDSLPGRILGERHFEYNHASLIIFAKKTMRQCLDQAGFEVVYSQSERQYASLGRIIGYLKQNLALKALRALRIDDHSAHCARHRVLHLSKEGPVIRSPWTILKWRPLRVQAVIYMLLVGIIAGLVGWINQSYIKELGRWYLTERPYMLKSVRPYALTAAAEQALKPKDSFRECASEQGKDYCPEMVVIPAGSFVMGSPPTEKGRYITEGPQRRITIAQPFAVSKFELTFDEWDTCVAYGDCPQAWDFGWGRGQRPVIHVNWDDAQHYIAWLSRMTSKPYRLLTEAEYEYATRGDAQSAYPWGDDIGKNNANCNGCGSQWDNSQTAPVGSFAPNGFGLYDMVGNIWEWVEDCAHNNNDGAPTNGSAWTEGGNCNFHVVRGGSWDVTPVNVRSAVRYWLPEVRGRGLGFRVGRTTP